MNKLIFLALFFISHVALAESAKVTINYPNKEVKTFRFYKQKTMQFLELKTPWTMCQVTFDDDSKFVSLTCTPAENEKTLSGNRFRLYSVLSICEESPNSEMLVINDMPTGKAKQGQSLGHTIQLECEK